MDATATNTINLDQFDLQPISSGSKGIRLDSSITTARLSEFTHGPNKQMVKFLTITLRDTHLAEWAGLQSGERYNLATYVNKETGRRSVVLTPDKHGEFTARTARGRSFVIRFGARDWFPETHDQLRCTTAMAQTKDGRSHIAIELPAVYGAKEAADSDAESDSKPSPKLEPPPPDPEQVRVVLEEANAIAREVAPPPPPPPVKPPPKPTPVFKPKPTPKPTPSTAVAVSSPPARRSVQSRQTRMNNFAGIADAVLARPVPSAPKDSAIAALFPPVTAYEYNGNALVFSAKGTTIHRSDLGPEQMLVDFINVLADHQKRGELASLSTAKTLFSTKTGAMYSYSETGDQINAFKEALYRAGFLLINHQNKNLFGLAERV